MSLARLSNPLRPDDSEASLGAGSEMGLARLSSPLEFACLPLTSLSLSMWRENGRVSRCGKSIYGAGPPEVVLFFV